MKIFITGANRGIGLEFVRQYLANGDTVFAAARKPEEAAELNTLTSLYPDTLTLIALDVANTESIASAAQTVREHTNALDVLINNAGINPPGIQSLDQITPETMVSVFTTNAVGALMVVKAFLDLLKSGSSPRVVNISSQVGSLDWKKSGGGYAYASSKAAMNMITRCLSTDLKPFGITTITTHPGWVQTDMGGERAALRPEESVSGLIKLIAGLSPEDNGQFFKWNGEPHAW